MAIHNVKQYDVKYRKVGSTTQSITKQVIARNFAEAVQGALTFVNEHNDSDEEPVDNTYINEVISVVLSKENVQYEDGNTDDVVSISVSTTPLEVTIEESLPITLTYATSDNNGLEMGAKTWKLVSTDPTKATISDDGHSVVGVAAGSVIIVAIATISDITCTFTVTVNAA